VKKALLSRLEDRAPVGVVVEGRAVTAATFRDDVDLSWRLAEKKETLVHAPGAVVLHERRATISDYLRQKRCYGAGEGLLYKKYPLRNPQRGGIYGGAGSWLSQARGFNVASWRNHEIVYSLISDLDEQDVLALVRSAELDRTFWGWTTPDWVHLLGRDQAEFRRHAPTWAGDEVRPYLAAHAYLLGRFSEFHLLGSFQRLTLSWRILSSQVRVKLPACQVMAK